ncbi:HAD family hydrolase [Staphylococcus hyicus]|uniref:HAD family hydrolase n=1 Tax=Staphylococcus hyicus TaxID=1284 RepID=UPI000D1EDAB0|nr:HAD family hydrolase [Staphylococcus hyicus]MCQ9291262.1 HAD family hydrolase [Staphylococcus hyicus]MCQ9306503.1 HAD family hydrolase [Staphylococcus hyicus]MCQ9308916.1 HAD family hydrolase [Staphylococcus hyicus]MCQ9311337.1 HAD family hydrolase [Staphylococcus hyicus]NJH99681.1 HAD-IA family hydrolase [Staphylococcus hyicus]
MTYTFIFDLDDTLYDQLQAFNVAYHYHFADSDIDVSSLYRHFRHYSDLVFEQTQDGRMTVTEMHIYRITAALNDFDIALPEKKAIAFQRDYARALNGIALSHPIKTLLYQLKTKRVPCGIITNGESHHQRSKIKTLGLNHYISESHMFISAEEGMSKPDVALFQQVVNELDLNPQNTFYIGDNFENDVIGALNAGWRVIWFNRRNRSATHEGYKPDYYVDSEEALVEVIQSLINEKI